MAPKSAEGFAVLWTHPQDLSMGGHIRIMLTVGWPLLLSTLLKLR